MTADIQQTLEFDPLLPLKNQIAFVTGSTSGIGRSIALRFARDGADVIIHGRNAERAEEVRTKVQALGRKVAVVIADISIPTERDRACNEAMLAFGQVDILVNNAGFGMYSPFLSLKDDQVDFIIDTNLRALIFVTKRILKKMYRNPPGLNGIRGRIINISSTGGKTGHKNFNVYDSTKFAIVGFTQSLALEMISRKILVNAICPGVIDTPIWGASGAAGLGFKRYGAPEDVAEVAAFLANPQNMHMTGQSLNIGGDLEFH